jgi:penicillin-binding protein 2A
MGLNKGIDSVKRFGIPVTKQDQNLALALGGMSKGVSPLQMADAYSTFPNGGKRMDSHLITKIVGPTGNIIAEHKPNSTKVTSKSVTDQMTSMLLNVVESGTGARAQIPNVQIAAKTGSTQLPYNDISGTKDQWMVGYTPNLVGSVWVGYDQTDREHYLPGSSETVAVPLFKEIMSSALPYVPQEQFDVVSINDQLAGKTRTKEEIAKQAQKISEELNANAQKLGQTIKEQAPNWKKGLDQAMQNIGNAVNSLVNKLQSLRQ